MLKEGASDFYLVYPRTRVNGTRGRKRGFSRASTANLSKEQTRFAVESLQSFVSLFQSKLASTNQVARDGSGPGGSLAQTNASMSPGTN